MTRDSLFCIVRVKCLRINPITAWKWDLSLLKDEPRWLIWILYSRISHVHFLWFSRFQNATLKNVSGWFQKYFFEVTFLFIPLLQWCKCQNHVSDKIKRWQLKDDGNILCLGRPWIMVHDRDQSPTLCLLDDKFQISVEWHEWFWWHDKSPPIQFCHHEIWNSQIAIFGNKDWNKLLLKYRRPKARSNGSENSRL